MKRLALVALVAAFLPAGGAAATAAKFNPDPVFPAGAISETTSHRDREARPRRLDARRPAASVNCWSQKDWKRLQLWNGARP